MDLILNSNWFEVLRFLLDIMLVASIIYLLYNIFQDTGAGILIQGIVILALLYGVSYLLQLNTMLWILSYIGPAVIIGFAVVFQPELRKVLITIGKGGFFRKRQSHTYPIGDIMGAAKKLQQQKRGALIVIPRRDNLLDVIETGVLIKGIVSQELIISIFEFDTPLHDGAIVLKGNIIEAGGCVLPLSSRKSDLKAFGTRHRAALGMSEESDAVILVVSEERGTLSLAYNGYLLYDRSFDEIQKQLTVLFVRSVEKTNETHS